jgi:hypothetical protein
MNAALSGLSTVLFGYCGFCGSVTALMARGMVNPVSTCGASVPELRSCFASH